MSTEDRLARVERELAAAKRRNRLLIGMGLTAVVVALSCATTQTVGSAPQTQVPEGKVLRANSFILEDEKGRPRAELTAGETGAGLVLYDEAGEVRAQLAVPQDGVRLFLYDREGVPRASLSAHKAGGSLGLYGQGVAVLDASKARPSLLLRDEKGKVIWNAP